MKVFWRGIQFSRQKVHIVSALKSYITNKISELRTNDSFINENIKYTTLSS